MLKLTFSSLSISILCLAFLSTPGPAQSKPIPPTDADIDRVIAKVRPFEELARQCNASECPKLDCRTAEDIHNRLRDARIYMRYAYYWNKRAADSQMDHFKSIAGESTLASERAARVQKILAYQEWVVGIASSLLDIASVMGSLDEIVNNPKLLEQKSYPEIAEMLDTFYEGMKDAESLHNRLKEAQTGEKFPKPIADMMPALGSLTSEQMNDLKSTVSDLGSLIKAAQEHGKDWRKILKEGKGARSIGQIVGRVAKAYADAEIKQRSRLVDKILEDIVASDAAQTQSFKDLQRIQARRNKAEDAYLALSQLLIFGQGSNGGMTSCLMKLGSRCSSFDLGYTSKWKAPDDIEVQDFNVITERDKQKSWGRALLTINSGLPMVEQWLRNVPKLEAGSQPSLRLQKATFTSGEELSVQYAASDCLGTGSWIGIVPVAAPHGKEQVNADNVRSEKHGISTVGSATFKAPTEPGRYDVRMNDPRSGLELASVTFEVTPSAVIALSGSWILHYGPNRVWDKKSDQLYRFEMEGDSVRWGWTSADGKMTHPRIGIRAGNIILTSWGRACGYGPNGLKVGEERDDIPLRLIISDDGDKITWQMRQTHCSDTGKLTVLDDWEGTGVWDKPWTLYRGPVDGKLPAAAAGIPAPTAPWDNENSPVPEYNKLVRQYKEVRSIIELPNISDADRTNARWRIEDLLFDAKFKCVVAASGPQANATAKTLYEMFIAELTRELARLKATPAGTTPRE